MSKSNRMYSLALGEGGNVILPWAALVMASLLLSSRPMKGIDVAVDLAGGKNDTAKSINSTICGALKKLEGKGFVHSLHDGYKPSAKGKREFLPALNVAMNSARWDSLSDSRLFNA